MQHQDVLNKDYATQSILGESSSANPLYSIQRLNALDAADCNTHKNPLFAAALHLSEEGIPILPIRFKSKQPEWGLISSEDGHKVTRYFLKHPRSVEEVKQWYDSHPDLNIGVACGEVTGFICIDIDYRNGGEKTWKRLIGTSDPAMPLHRTGNGLHAYIKYPGYSFDLTTKWKGIDVLSNGKYVVWPPSVHSTGSPYEIVNRFGDYELTNPDWLMSNISAKTPLSLQNPTKLLPVGNIDKANLQPQHESLQKLDMHTLCDMQRRMQRLNRDRTKYRSDSEFDMAVITQLIGCGAQFAEIEELFIFNEGGK